MRVIRIQGKALRRFLCRLLMLVQGDIRLGEEIQGSCFVINATIQINEPGQVVLALSMPVLLVQHLAQIIQWFLRVVFHLEALLIQHGGLVQVVHLSMTVRCALQCIGVRRAELQRALVPPLRLVQSVLPVGVVAPAGRKAHNRLDIVRVGLQRLLELFPRLPPLALGQKLIAISHAVRGRGTVQLRQALLALLLALGVLQIRADREQLAPEVHSVGRVRKRTFQGLLGVPPRTDRNLHAGHLRLDLLRFLHARSPLQGGPEVMKRLAGACGLPGRVQLRHAQVRLVIQWIRFQDPLQPDQGVLVPACSLVQCGQGHHGRGIARLEGKPLLKRPHRLLVAARLGARPAQAEKHGGVRRRRSAGSAARQAVRLLRAAGLQRELGKPEEWLYARQSRDTDLLVQLLRLREVLPLHADPGQAQQRRLVAGPRA
mmetsp:Transcript_43431/g.131311  ORF Transcript_43431/g.131311 Transcript_43431/m.131311 type:complete len:430 (+) Transcript_43431:913-2202(+)